MNREDKISSLLYRMMSQYHIAGAELYTTGADQYKVHLIRDNGKKVFLPMVFQDKDEANLVVERINS